MHIIIKQNRLKMRKRFIYQVPQSSFRNKRHTCVLLYLYRLPCIYIYTFSSFNVYKLKST